jgi:hypothetical protein
MDSGSWEVGAISTQACWSSGCLDPSRLTHPVAPKIWEAQGQRQKKAMHSNRRKVGLDSPIPCMTSFREGWTFHIVQCLVLSWTVSSPGCNAWPLGPSVGVEHRDANGQISPWSLTSLWLSWYPWDKSLSVTASHGHDWTGERCVRWPYESSHHWGESYWPLGELIKVSSRVLLYRL